MFVTNKEGNIIIVTFRKLPSNAFDIKFLKELYLTLSKIERDKYIHGVVLSSDIKSIFSSGLDLKSITAKSSKLLRLNLIHTVWYVFRITKLIMKSKKIYVASLSGAVIGSAVSIVMACDFRFASPNTWFWLPDPQYGGLLADGGLDIIKSICGLACAKQLSLTNDRINVEDAKSMGIISKIIIDRSLKEYSCQYALDLFNKYSFQTLQITKAILNKSIMNKFHLIKLCKVVFSNEMANQLVKYHLWENK